MLPVSASLVRVNIKRSPAPTCAFAYNDSRKPPVNARINRTRGYKFLQYTEKIKAEYITNDKKLKTFFFTEQYLIVIVLIL